MPDYIEEFDLACFPDEKPQEGRRECVGIQRGDTFDKTYRGYKLWIGGSGRGGVKTLREARVALRVILEADLQRKIARANAQIHYYEKQLASLDKHFAAMQDKRRKALPSIDSSHDG